MSVPPEALEWIGVPLFFTYLNTVDSVSVVTPVFESPISCEWLRTIRSPRIGPSRYISRLHFHFRTSCTRQFLFCFPRPQTL